MNADPKKVYPFMSAEPKFTRLDEAHQFLGHLPERTWYLGKKLLPVDLYFHKANPWGDQGNAVPEIVQFDGKSSSSSMGPDGDGLFFADDRFFHIGLVLAERSGLDVGSGVGPFDPALELQRETAIEQISQEDHFRYPDSDANMAKYLNTEAAILSAKNHDQISAAVAQNKTRTATPEYAETTKLEPVENASKRSKPDQIIRSQKVREY